MKRFLPVLLLLPALTALAELEISDAWIKHLPPTVPVRAGYLTIHNPTSRSVTIESVHSDAFHHVEMHETVEQDGMMQMRPVMQLTIEPDSSVQLSPGGLHLMLMQPVKESAPGNVIEITIKFDNGDEQTFRMTVKE